MDWTDVHYRHLARLISKHTWLYTEMVVDQTLIHNPHTDRSALPFFEHVSTRCNDYDAVCLSTWR
jgi:tRNA-dihydrouridine synthase